jgi:hypothetical protein
MTDQKLLELAAKAAGVGPILCYESARNCLRVGDRKSYKLWRPLTDDGDALMLGVSIRADVTRLHRCVHVAGIGPGYGLQGASIYFEDSSLEGRATAERRAYVELAAKIGATMP